MTQSEQLLYEIERRGGSITTHDLMGLRISQYQARLKGLREKLALKGWTLTEGQPIEGKKRCFLYRLIKPKDEQLELFGSAA